MECSRCHKKAGINTLNWKKLEEHSCTSYTIENAIIRNYVESKPYWILCPRCYEDLFSGLTRYKDRTETKTIRDNTTYFTSSTSDYADQPTIVVKANTPTSTIAYIN